MACPARYGSALGYSCRVLPSRRWTSRWNGKYEFLGNRFKYVSSYTAQMLMNLETRRSDIEDAFRSFTSRKDIGIILINQHICDDIRHVVKEYSESGQTIPTILEIPSVDHPYDPSKDSIMQRVQVFFGGNISA